MLKFKLIAFMLLVCFNAAFAQSVKVSGTVVDKASIPLPGVNVVEAGTSNGTITDVQGQFSISVNNAQAALLFSYIGYKDFETALQGRTNLNIQLEIDAVSIEQVVVVGYTTQNKKDITGAVSVVNTEDLENITYANAMQSLQGRVSGLTITQDGQPGSGRTQVRVRGITTVNNNNPLYVVDGIPVETSIENINPNDIESMQVLKDAAAASVYGSRSAGGVIIITTKKGKQGKLQVDASGQYGIQTIANQIETLDGTQWGEVYWQASRNAFPGAQPEHPLYIETGNGPVVNTTPFLLPNGQVYQLTNEGTDWSKEVYQNARTQQYNLSVSNGTEKGNYYLGTSYFSQDGLIQKTYYDRITVRANSDYNITKWLQVGENFSVSFSDQVQIGSQQGQDGIPLDVIRQHPLHPVYDLQGNFAVRISGLPDLRNMVSVLDKNQDNNNRIFRLLGNMFATIKIFDAIPAISNKHGLDLKTNLGLDYNDYYKRQFNARFSEGDYDVQTNSLTNDYGRNNTVTWSNTLEYSLNLDNHSLKVIGGIETVSFDHFYLIGTGFDFEVESIDFTYLSAAAGDRNTLGGGTDWGLYSQFGQAFYSFLDRYFVTGVIRRDQTSRFNDIGVFPALSLGWRLSSEPFMSGVISSSSISNLKLRGSWGVQGNQNAGTTGDYAIYSTLGSPSDRPLPNYDMPGNNNSSQQGYAVIRRGNPNLRWETTTQYNIGADIGFFDNMFDLIFEYYVKQTDDILYPRPQLSAMGEGISPIINSGSLETKGFDIALQYNYINPSNDWHFDAQFQLSHANNEISYIDSIVGLKGMEGELYFDGYGASRVATGHPLGVFFGYEAQGLFQSDEEALAHALQNDGKGNQAGRIKYKDQNDDMVIDDKDRTYLGSPQPKVNLGLSLSADYKGVELSMFFYSALGNKVYNYTRWYTDFAQNGLFNHGIRILDAWSPTNTGSSIPAPTLVNDNVEDRNSSYYIEDGSYLKMRSLRLGYTLPKRWTPNFRVFLYSEIQNVFTLTSYTGVDPEVPHAGGSVNFPGHDMGVYPLPRTFIFGLNIKI